MKQLAIVIFFMTVSLNVHAVDGYMSMGAFEQTTGKSIHMGLGETLDDDTIIKGQVGLRHNLADDMSIEFEHIHFKALRSINPGFGFTGVSITVKLF